MFTRFLITIINFLRKPIDFIKGLLKKPQYSRERRQELEEALRITTERDRKKDAEADRKNRLNHSEKRYDWLCSIGLTPRVHIPADPKKDKQPSYYRLVMDKVHEISREAKRAGKPIRNADYNRNKHGIPLGAYGLEPKPNLVYLSPLAE